MTIEKLNRAIIARMTGDDQRALRWFERMTLELNRIIGSGGIPDGVRGDVAVTGAGTLFMPDRRIPDHRHLQLPRHDRIGQVGG